MKKSLIVLCFLTVYSALNAAELKPIGEFRFLGGQYFFNQAPSSLSGNMSLTVVPALKFSSKFSLIPTYMASYRGTREVNDLAGGGTLFQDGQNHLASLKGIYSILPELKLKLGASYRMELLRETKDETWGKGLFDYRKANGGFEAEYTYKKNQSVRAGADYFTLAFPNYESLESSVTAPGLGRELSGKNVLDCANLMSTLELNNSIGLLKTELGLGLTNKNYYSQPVVQNDGGLSAENRKDIYSFCSASAGYPVKINDTLGCIASLDGQFILNDSNQAHYDAVKFKYIQDYYDYVLMGAGAGLNFMIGRKPFIVSAGIHLNAKNYRERIVQDTNGDYSGPGEKIYVNETVTTIGIVYPINRSFKLRVSAALIDSRSNMKYEKTYTYNYQSANYLTGFSYEF